jgi:hypothetical protein
VLAFRALVDCNSFVYVDVGFVLAGGALFALQWPWVDLRLVVLRFALVAKVDVLVVAVVVAGIVYLLSRFSHALVLSM